jgi:hypothetical protein
MNTYKVYIPAQTEPSIFAFRGNSQGDTSVSNNLEDYLGSGGWMSINSDFKDISPLTQEAIDARVIELTKKWKPTKGGNVELTVMPNPLLDKNTYKSSMESYGFRMLDFKR